MVRSEGDTCTERKYVHPMKVPESRFTRDSGSAAVMRLVQFRKLLTRIQLNSIPRSVVTSDKSRKPEPEI